MKRLGIILFAVIGLAGLAWATPFSGIDGVARYLKGGLYVHPGTIAIASTNKVTRMLGNSATIDFTSASTGVALSAGITVTGAQAGDPCFVGVPTAAAALKAKFGCYVSATNIVKVWFSPSDTVDTSCALVSGTPSACAAQTVSASSLCTCSPVGTTAAVAAAACAVSVTSTTLTVTGPDTSTTTINYRCAAPVDPASGTYYVRVISSQ